MKSSTYNMSRVRKTEVRSHCGHRGRPSLASEISAALVAAAGHALARGRAHGLASLSRPGSEFGGGFVEAIECELV